MSKPIKKNSIKFIDRKFRPDFNFNLLYVTGLKCSFKCEYCQFYNDTKSLNQYTQDIKFIKYLEKFYPSYNKNISLYGGEPTNNIDVIQFINEFKNNWQITLLTNLNYNTRYLKDILNSMNSKSLHFIISIHFHRINDLDDYFKKIDLIIQNNNIVTLRAMCEKNQKEKILNTFDRYCNKYENVKVINRLIYPIEEYTDIELYNYINNNYDNPYLRLKYNTKIFNERDFIELGYNNFLYSRCPAGKKRLVLAEDGNVYRCESMYLKNKFQSFNIYKDDYTKIKFPISETICLLDDCRCELYLNE
jgi:sulfatase maturation enzyme AslB (radical SAM superfamily)